MEKQKKIFKAFLSSKLAIFTQNASTITLKFKKKLKKC